MFDVRRFKQNLSAVKKHNHITGSHFAVGHALLVFVNRHGNCWPSQLTLATEAGCDPKTVREGLQRMRDLGMLSWVQQAGQWNRRQPNLYTLRSDVVVPKTKKKNLSKGSAPVPPAGPRPLPYAAQLALIGPPPPNPAAMAAAREARVMAEWEAGRAARRVRMGAMPAR